MKTITTKVYDARALRRYHPEGFATALEKYRQHVAEDGFTMNEVMDSLKGIYEAAGVKMRDWEIGPYSHSYIRASWGENLVNDPGDLHGARALAWVENNLLAQFRAPYGLDKKDGNLHENGDNGKRGMHYRRRWARWYEPGSVKACPFTGLCFDDDMIDALLKSLRAGDTLREAFEGLASAAQRIIEAEDEYQSQESSFIEAAEANGWEYTREGRMI